MQQGYYQPVVQVNKGIPKWRLLLVFASVVFLLTKLPVESTDAATFAGNSTNGCVTSPTVIAQFDVAGWGGGEVDFHLTIPHGGIVTGRWVLSNGYSFPGYSWGIGPEDVSREWWVENRTFQVPAGTGGTAKFIVFKGADYGGCYTVDRVVVTQHPLVQGDPAPATSAQPSATPGPTPPPGYDCNGSTEVEDCDEPPSGWCWVGRFVEAGDPQLAECDDTPDEGTGGGPPGDCLTSVDGAGSSAYVTPEAGYLYFSQVSFSTTGNRSGYSFRYGSAGGSVVIGNGFGVSDGSTVAGTFTGTAYGGTGIPATDGWTSNIGVWDGTAASGHGWVSVSSGQSITIWGDYTVPLPGNPPPVHYSNEGTMCFEFDTLGPTEHEAGEGTPPGPAPSPSSYPSQPPNEGGQGGGPIDQCEGPDDAGLIMCQGEFPPFEICPEDSDLAICQVATPVPSGPAAFGSFVPDPSGWIEMVGTKAPFGFVTQVVDAVGEGAAAPDAGAGPGGCFMCLELPVWAPAEAGGSHTETVDIPIDEMAASAGTFRAVLLIILTIGFGIALLKIASNSMGGGTD